MRAFEYLMKFFIESNMYMDSTPVECLRDLYKNMYADGFCKMLEIAEECEVSITELVEWAEEARIERLERKIKVGE